MRKKEERRNKKKDIYEPQLQNIMNASATQVGHRNRPLFSELTDKSRLDDHGVFDSVWSMITFAVDGFALKALNQ